MLKKVVFAVILVVVLAAALSPAVAAAAGGEDDQLVKTLTDVRTVLGKAAYASYKVSARTCAKNFKRLAEGNIALEDLPATCTTDLQPRLVARVYCEMQVDARKGVLKTPRGWKKATFDSFCQWAVDSK